MPIYMPHPPSISNTSQAFPKPHSQMTVRMPCLFNALQPASSTALIWRCPLLNRETSYHSVSNQPPSKPPAVRHLHTELVGGSRMDPTWPLNITGECRYFDRATSPLKFSQRSIRGMVAHLRAPCSWPRGNQIPSKNGL